MANVNLYVEEGPLQDFPVEGLPRQGSGVEEGSSTGPIEGHNCEILTSQKPRTGQQNQAWTYIPTPQRRGLEHADDNFTQSLVVNSRGAGGATAAPKPSVAA